MSLPIVLTLPAELLHLIIDALDPYSLNSLLQAFPELCKAFVLFIDDDNCKPRMYTAPGLLCLPFSELETFPRNTRLELVELTEPTRHLKIHRETVYPPRTIQQPAFWKRLNYMCRVMLVTIYPGDPLIVHLKHLLSTTNAAVDVGPCFEADAIINKDTLHTLPQVSQDQNVRSSRVEYVDSLKDVEFPYLQTLTVVFGISSAKPLISGVKIGTRYECNNLHIVYEGTVLPTIFNSSCARDVNVLEFTAMCSMRSHIRFCQALDHQKALDYHSNSSSCVQEEDGDPTDNDAGDESPKFTSLFQDFLWAGPARVLNVSGGSWRLFYSLSRSVRIRRSYLDFPPWPQSIAGAISLKCSCAMEFQRGLPPLARVGHREHSWPLICWSSKERWGSLGLEVHGSLYRSLGLYSSLSMGQITCSYHEFKDKPRLFSLVCHDTGPLFKRYIMGELTQHEECSPIFGVIKVLCENYRPYMSHRHYSDALGAWGHGWAPFAMCAVHCYGPDGRCSSISEEERDTAIEFFDKRSIHEEALDQMPLESFSEHYNPGKPMLSSPSTHFLSLAGIDISCRVLSSTPGRDQLRVGVNNFDIHGTFYEDIFRNDECLVVQTDNVGIVNRLPWDEGYGLPFERRAPCRSMNKYNGSS